MTTGAGCAWTARTDAPWGIVSPTSGSGTTAATLRLDDNTKLDGRTVMVIINGQSFAVAQEGYGCTYALNPSTVEARNEGSEHQVQVNTAPGCPWTVTTSDSWITVRTASGTGTDWAYFTVARNTGDARTGSVIIAGQRVMVTQPRG